MNSDNATQEYGHIKSFVSNRGHLTKAQAEAIEKNFPRWGLQYDPQKPLNFTEVFARNAPNWLEIGFGMGETTRLIAQNHSDKNYLGIEVYPAGVGSLLKQIEQSDIENLRIIWHDAMDVMQHMIKDESLEQIMIFFPDPWRKKRHHKRRLIRPDFVKLISQKLKPGGVLHCATDWENYAEHMLETLNSNAALSNMYENFAPKPDYRPLTKFENRGLKLGHGVWDLLYKKNST